MSTLKSLSNTEDRGVKNVEIRIDAADRDQLIFETLPVKNPLSNWA
jgi:hypothetical protein